MARVAITGTTVGYCVKSNEKTGEKYGVIDLLQYGEQNQRSELMPLLVYDTEILSWLQNRFSRSKHYLSAYVCNVITLPTKKEILWVVTAVKKFEPEKMEVRDESGAATTADTGNTEQNERMVDS